MTQTLSEDLNFCYTLLFTGETELKKTCYMKSLLCFENCRKTAGKLVGADSVYMYCYFRALRKESQTLRYLGLHKRSYRILRKGIKKVAANWYSTEKLLVLLQLYDLSEEFEPEKSEEFFKMLNKESAELKKES